MAFEIKTEITINASPEKVWGILSNFEAYPSWNPFIKSISGQVAVGQKITVKIAPQNSSEMTFKPKVLTFAKNKELTWLGHLLFSGIFDGTHKFELLDHGNGTTTFNQSEIFKGILVPLFKSQLNKNTKHGFIAMNEKLKQLAEKA
ncbi:SRPBCC domain-containing protein [uncultured Arcticibacterium sp.]|uniref:SRPBCC domain-containing protein n=1 Tax=uncultured Arcticibacterium sp. TaxID=2173042 RepID=UPI0030F5F314